MMKVKGYEIKKFANLFGANLRMADLRMADLRGANLFGANLGGADLRGANLGGADLYGADLCEADLGGANLYGADLFGADLYGANLGRANLFGADLFGAKNIPTSIQAELQVMPDGGDIVGWKKCKNGVIVKLLIKADTARSSATTRKCRAKEVEVLGVIGDEVGISRHDNETEYKVGHTVVCDKWEEDRWIECAGGIHFFITRQEAEDY